MARFLTALFNTTSKNVTKNSFPTIFFQTVCRIQRTRHIITLTDIKNYVTVLSRAARKYVPVQFSSSHL